MDIKSLTFKLHQKDKLENVLTDMINFGILSKMVIQIKITSKDMKEL